MSESLILSLLLAFSGGFQDAYTYIERGHVFANAQTGNVVLMSVSLLDGNIHAVIRYITPLFAFIAGTIVADLIEHRMKEVQVIHWRQMIIMAEVIVMFITGLFPESMNMEANCLISFTCAMQVETFRYFCGNAYASTMIIGNMRSGTHALSEAMIYHSKADLKHACEYFGVILVFGIGAAFSALLTPVMDEKTIWCSCLILLICYVIMELDKVDMTSLED